MTFLQPALLWGLPAIGIPLLIHLLNRLRYRSLKWAAMMFLISATRTAARRARLRHHLILLTRTAMVLAVVLAASRPVAGGLIAAFCGGEPETVIVLLDRSASMEALHPRIRESMRVRALKLFSQSAGRLRRSGRFVLIENVLRKPQEVGAGVALEDVILAGPTDTAADMPALFRAAADYIVENKCGRTEIWAASDLQKNNWRPDSEEWKSLNARLSSLPREVTVRILAAERSGDRDASVSLRAVERRNAGGRTRLGLGFDIARGKTAPSAFPLVLTVDGARSQLDIGMTAQLLRYSTGLELPGSTERGGWGKAELPADDNVRNNSCFFVYGGAARLGALLVPGSTVLSRSLGLAAAPSPDDADRSCDTIAPERLDGAELKDAALLIWQRALPGDTIAANITAFAREGGVAAFFPPDSPLESEAEEGGESTGLRWGGIEAAPEGNPFRIAAWDEYDGPLARTDDGANLPVNAVEVFRRRIPRAAENGGGEGEWITLATFADGRPFLLRRRLGRGAMFACATLPHESWSALGDGSVLVPMMQRMLLAGGEKLTRAANDICGAWTPAAEENWIVADSAARKDCRWNAGVYTFGNRMLALNRPAGEDDPEIVLPGSVPGLLEDVEVRLVEDVSEDAAGKSEGELWRFFVYCALALMAIEAALLLAERTRVKAVGMEAAS